MSDKRRNGVYDRVALTPIEEKVWALRQQGKKRGEIGAELNLKPVTVTRYLVTIKEKVDINSAFSEAQNNG